MLGRLYGSIVVNGKKINRVKIRSLATSLPELNFTWKDEAKCRGEDVNKFIYASDFPTDKQREKLTEFCNTCPVLMDCRYEGLRTMSDGWWGGMTPQERYEWAATDLFEDQL